MHRMPIPSTPVLTYLVSDATTLYLEACAVNTTAAEITLQYFYDVV